MKKITKKDILFYGVDCQEGGSDYVQFLVKDKALKVFNGPFQLGDWFWVGSPTPETPFNMAISSSSWEYESKLVKKYFTTEAMDIIEDILYHFYSVE